MKTFIKKNIKVILAIMMALLLIDVLYNIIKHDWMELFFCVPILVLCIVFFILYSKEPLIPKDNGGR